ncbi:hypothetical protein ACFL2H_02830 [Planctomycetota bacterium]
MRRAFELADSLNKENDEDIQKRIEALITEQQALLGEVGQVVELSHSLTEADLDGDRFREQLRKLAVRQRQLLSDANSVFEDAATELQKLNEEKSDDTPPEQLQRAAQLSYATSYLQKATQRMGQARSQLRLRKQDRAFRRQAVTVEELKRARDVFREPAERIRGVLQDAVPLHMQTMAFSQNAGTLANEDQREFEVPAWLTSELLVDMQVSMTERTNELSQQISAGVESMKQSSDDEADSPEVSEAEQQSWQSVSAHLGEASAHFVEADRQLAAEQFDSAAGKQADAIGELQRAEELLLDFRGLIERAFADQTQIQQLLPTVTSTISEAEFTELAEAINQFQTGNLTRTNRIVTKLGEELTRITSDTPAPENQPAADPDQQENEADKFHKAIRLAEQVKREMESTIKAIETAKLTPATDDEPPQENEPDGDDGGSATATESPFKDAASSSQIAVDKLQELRRLFFTIVQRLSEAAQYQSDINDETQQVTIHEDFPLTARGPISLRQTENQTTTEQLAMELAEQADAAANSGNGPASPDQQSANEKTAQNYRQAAELVTDSSADMANSATMLQADSEFDFDKTQTAQQSALQKLLEAIALLQPPNESDDNQDQSQDQQDNQNQEPNEDEQQEQPQDNQSNSLLQMIRDKEAQRRDENAKRARRLVPANGPDW